MSISDHSLRQGLFGMMWYFLHVDLGMLTYSVCRKGDYYRYLAEFKTGNEKKEAADQSMKAYEVQFMLL